MTTEQAVGQQQRNASHKQTLAVGITGGCLFLLTLGSLMVVLNVSSRLAVPKTISDKLAQGELAGLAIEIHGNDEVGDFGRSLQGVRSAIEDLANARRSELIS